MTKSNIFVLDLARHSNNTSIKGQQKLNAQTAYTSERHTRVKQTTTNERDIYYDLFII